MNINDLMKNDLPFLYSEAGVSVSYNSYSTMGILLHEPTDVLSMNDKQYAIQDTTLTLTIPANSLGPLKNNTTITADSKVYKISKYIVLSNGLETKLWLIGA
jgi:hypothetical protein